MIVTIILVVAKFLRDTSAEGEGERKEKREKPQGANKNKNLHSTRRSPPPKTPTAEGLLAQALGQDLCLKGMVRVVLLEAHNREVDKCVYSPLPPRAGQKPVPRVYSYSVARAARRP